MIELGAMLLTVVGVIWRFSSMTGMLRSQIDSLTQSNQHLADSVSGLGTKLEGYLVTHVRLETEQGHCVRRLEQLESQVQTQWKRIDSILGRRDSDR